MVNILLLQGPNLNLLGKREPERYGAITLEQLHNKLAGIAETLQAKLNCKQSNSEHELIDTIHACSENTDFIIFNPAAFTHTSIALRDALSAVNIPFVEVHISNIFSRESFRRESYFSDIATGTISGLGVYGYELALHAAINHIRMTNKEETTWTYEK